MGSFAHCLADHCSNEKWSQVPLTYTLPKKKCNIQNNYRICISCNGISAILWKFPLMDITQGHWPWSRVTVKISEINVVFLLGKSVGSKMAQWGHFYFIRMNSFQVLVYLLIHEKWPISIKRRNYIGYLQQSLYFPRVTGKIRKNLLDRPITKIKTLSQKN